MAEMEHQHFHRRDKLDAILRREDEILHVEEQILHELHHPCTTGFTAIKETHMVPLAAGQTATFSTTPIPAGTTPDPTKIVWSSSDTAHCPVVVNPDDPTGLSANVTFADATPAGLNFVLTIEYTNPDGTTASQPNTFVTVAPVLDITGFNAIEQTA